MRAKNVSVHLYGHGGELKVWCISLNLQGSIPKKDGVQDQEVVRRIQKAIQKIVEQIDFPEEM